MSQISPDPNIGFCLSARKCLLLLQNSDQETALHCGAQHGHAEVVRVLVRRGGADPNIKNCREETPLDLASLYGRSVERRTTTKS